MPTIKTNKDYRSLAAMNFTIGTSMIAVFGTLTGSGHHDIWTKILLVTAIANFVSGGIMLSKAKR